MAVSPSPPPRPAHLMVRGGAHLFTVPRTTGRSPARQGKSSTGADGGVYGPHPNMRCERTQQRQGLSRPPQPEGGAPKHGSGSASNPRQSACSQALQNQLPRWEDNPCIHEATARRPNGRCRHLMAALGPPARASGGAGRRPGPPPPHGGAHSKQVAAAQDARRRQRWAHPRWASTAAIAQGTAPVGTGTAGAPRPQPRWPTPCSRLGPRPGLLEPF